MVEAGFPEARFVFFDCLGDENVVQRAAFLADFEIAVAVVAFEIVVQIEEVLLGFGIGEADFFG